MTGPRGCCARAARGHATAVMAKSVINSRRLMLIAPRSRRGIVPAQPSSLRGWEVAQTQVAEQTVDVRDGSKTEVSGLARHVRFTLRRRYFHPAPACPFYEW